MGLALLRNPVPDSQQDATVSIYQLHLLVLPAAPFLRKGSDMRGLACTAAEDSSNSRARMTEDLSLRQSGIPVCSTAWMGLRLDAMEILATYPDLEQ